MESFIKSSPKLAPILNHCYGITVIVILSCFILSFIVWAQHDNSQLDLTNAPTALLIGNKVKQPFKTPKTEYVKFSVSELDNSLFSDPFLANNDQILGSIVEYCKVHVLKTQYAQMNCNSANKVNNSWYKISEASSIIIKAAFSSLPKFVLAILITLFILAGLINLFNIIQSFLRFIYFR